MLDTSNSSIFFLLIKNCDFTLHFMLLQMVQVNNFEGDEHVKQFGIQVKKELALVEARVLPPPTVITCQYVIFSREIILVTLL